MNTGTKYTAYIAVSLVLAAVFPLLGLIAGCVIGGMALNSYLAQGDIKNCDQNMLDEIRNVEDQIKQLEKQRWK